MSWENSEKESSIDGLLIHTFYLAGPDTNGNQLTCKRPVTMQIRLVARSYISMINIYQPNRLA